jgi:hypothetical protein
MQNGQPTTDNRRGRVSGFQLSVIGFSLALSGGVLGALAVGDFREVVRA